MNDNLRRTLLFASALQVLGDNHTIVQSLEQAVRQRDNEAFRAAEAAIASLSEDQSRELSERFENLCRCLPREALAVAA